MLRGLAGRRWRWMTLAALAMCAVVIRLGFWQVDRLAQRHAESARRSERLFAAPIRLDGTGTPVGQGTDTLRLFQPVVVRGTFDGSQQLALTNEIWNGQLGVHLLTPLVLEGGRAVLVDRGWVPASPDRPLEWNRYSLEGAAEVTGWVRPIERASGPLAVARAAPRDDDARLVPTLEARALQGRVTYALLPFVVTQYPPAGERVSEAALPYRRLPETDLGDGVHIIAAAQWFAIAGIIVVGQVVYVRRRLIEDEGRRTKDG